MPTAIVLGAGMVGSLMATDFAAEPGFDVTIADSRPEALERARARAAAAGREIDTLRVNLADTAALKRALERAVPRTLWTINRREPRCVPPQEVKVLGRRINVTPPIACTIVGRVTRGALRLHQLKDRQRGPLQGRLRRRELEHGRVPGGHGGGQGLDLSGHRLLGLARDLEPTREMEQADDTEACPRGHLPLLPGDIELDRLEASMFRVDRRAHRHEGAQRPGELDRVRNARSDGRPIRRYVEPSASLRIRQDAGLHDLRATDAALRPRRAQLRMERDGRKRRTIVGERLARLDLV